MKVELLLIFIIGFIIGQFINILDKYFAKYIRTIDEDKEFEYAINKHIKNSHFSLILGACTGIIFASIFYKFGFEINTIKWLILSIILISVFETDLRYTIIPDKLNFVGIIFAFIFSFINYSNMLDYILGALIGGGIFLVIAILSKLIYKVEGMGLGDVKLMLALGLFFGVYNIIAISLLSFVLGAIISLLLIIIRVKKTSDYIPFGPFIVIASFIIIFIPYTTIFNFYVNLITFNLNF